MSPPFLVNGVVLPRNEGWLQSMSSRVDMDLRVLQRQVYEDTIAEDTWLAGTFIESAVTHRNALIIPEDENSVEILDVANIVSKHDDIWQRMPRILADDSTRTELPALLVVVADIDTVDGAKLVAETVDFVKEEKSNADIELRVLHNPGPEPSFPLSVALHQHINTEGLETTCDKLKMIMTDEEIIGKAKGTGTADHPPEVLGMSKAFREFMQSFAQSIGLAPG